jgi:hypothetical protein
MISSSVCHVVGDDPELLTADHPKSWHLGRCVLGDTSEPPKFRRFDVTLDLAVGLSALPRKYL